MRTYGALCPPRLAVDALIEHHGLSAEDALGEVSQHAFDMLSEELDPWDSWRAGDVQNVLEQWVMNELLTAAPPMPRGEDSLSFDLFD